MIYEGIIAYVNSESLNESCWFPRSVIDEYVKSERCAKRLADGLILGTTTHKYRNGASDIPGLGEDDRLLDEGVITHCVRKLWLDGNKLCAQIEIFDDLNDYAPEELHVIKQLLRLIKNKVNVPCSIVADADWDDTNKMTYLYDLVGLDFTLNPALPGSKIESDKQVI